MAMAARMVAPARLSASKMGRPITLEYTVPGKDRHKKQHAIFWANSNKRSADAYNSVVTLYSKPDMRRWLELKGGRIPKGMPYLTLFAPESIKPHCERYWTVFRDGEPFVSYTNCIEAWMIVLAGTQFAPGTRWAMVYTDKSGRG
jgi:hypothetical protein